jgi:hydroxysqualene dehydroxylase
VSATPRVLVVGGGVAGIAAALDCAAGGARVTLVEVRRRLGGAAYSFQRDGLCLDNGQHVFLRGCVAYRGLLGRLGSEHRVFVQPRLEIPVLKPGAETVVLRRSSLPAPAHLAGALARYPHLSVLQRLGAARAALALRRLNRATLTAAGGARAHDLTRSLGPNGRRLGLGRAVRTRTHERALDSQTFGDWLARHGQDADAVSALWDLIALPTLNLPAARASLALGAFVFGAGVLSRADAADIGFHRATLSQTIGQPAERALERAGVEVRFGWRADALEKTSTGFEVHGRGEVLSAEVAIVAVPHTRAAGLLKRLLPQTSGRIAALGSSPIVNLHVVYDRPVCEESFAAGVGTPVQYLFDRTAAGGAPAGSQYLAVSLSGAEREMRMSLDALRERYLPALRALLPRARGARVEHFLVTREHAATFRAAPGVAALRPGPRTSVGGLVLAGAWTDTGWPATLEGAALSGHAAARQALAELGMRAVPPGAPGLAGAARSRA